MPEGAHTMFRPPAEAGSVLIRVVDGCPHNRCLFCAMYRDVPYREFDRSVLRQRIAQASREYPLARRVFLADGDALALDQNTLEFLLHELRASFPALSRVNCYASSRALANKSHSQLKLLRALGMHTLYLGLESGCPEILHFMGKGGKTEDAISGCIRAQSVGLCMSVIILIGLGGQDWSTRHVTDTISALNQMQPRLLSCLRLVPLPGTGLMERILQGKFKPLTEEKAVVELRALLAGLHLRRTAFRADHSSNILPLAGRLPRDKDSLLAELDELLDSGALDKHDFGPVPARL